MAETTLTLKFRGAEAEMLERMVDSGIFNTKSEAIRASLVHYSTELGLLNTKVLWENIKKYERKGTHPEDLIKEINKAKEAIKRQR